MIAAIVAVDNDWGIGFNGNLLERIPADLKRFKELTTGHTVIMGSKTWNSITKKPLPHRINIVVSKNYVVTCKSTLRFDLEDTINYLNCAKDDVYIIGGGQIYKELLPYCDIVYVTKIYKDHENIDTYFPNLDKSNEWEIQESSEVFMHKDISYQYLTYKRIIDFY